MADTTSQITALLPMRHASVRVKGKNYRSFGDGRPLFEHVLSALQACAGIDRVIINTDSDIVKDICGEKYPDVIIHDRPENLRDGHIAMNEIIANDLSRTGGDFFLQTHSTNPLISAVRFTEAINVFFENWPQYDSLFSVTKMQTRLWDEAGRPVNHDPDILLRTQDLPPLYEENSCFYLFHRQLIEQRGSRIGRKPFMFEIDKLESADIDIETDFTLAEQFFRLKNP